MQKHGKMWQAMFFCFLPLAFAGAVCGPQYPPLWLPACIQPPAVKVATFLTMPSSNPLITSNKAKQEEHMQVGSQFQSMLAFL